MALLKGSSGVLEHIQSDPGANLRLLFSFPAHPPGPIGGRWAGAQVLWRCHPSPAVGVDAPSSDGTTAPRPAPHGSAACAADTTPSPHHWEGCNGGSCGCRLGCPAGAARGVRVGRPVAGGQCGTRPGGVWAWGGGKGAQRRQPHSRWPVRQPNLRDLFLLLKPTCESPSIGSGPMPRRHGRF